MAITKLNTIQSGVESNYSNNYIKQALSNLGQRSGTKGDSIINQDFKIVDIKDITSNVNINDIEYLCVRYEPSNNDSMVCIANDNVLTADNSNLFSSLNTDVIVEKASIPIVEYIGGDWNDLSNVRIFKNQLTNSYFVSAICNKDGEIKEIIALEFDENFNVLLNCISLVIDNGYIKCVIGKTSQDSYDVKVPDDETLTEEEQLQYAIITGISNTVNFVITDKFQIPSTESYLDIYTNYFSNLNPETDDVSVNTIVDIIKTGATVDTVDIDEAYYKTKFNYYVNILPQYIKNEYNESVYISNNSYKGLKKYIIRQFIKKIYQDSGFRKEDNNVFDVYFNKEYTFACLVNSTTNGIYVSYDIMVNFLSSEIDTDNLTYITATSNIDDKICAYKFYVTYLDNDRYVDEILVDKLYTLPYISTNSVNENVWVINDTLTDIRTSGKDAGNPNIMMMSYIKARSGQQVSYASEDKIQIDVLHSYTETGGQQNIDYKDYLLLYSNETNGIRKSFSYYLPEFVSVNNSPEDSFEFTITLPNINEIIKIDSSFERIVNNTLLMTFVDIKISDTPKQTTLGYYTLQQILHGETNDTATSYVTVFWNIVKDQNTGVYDWQPIINPAFGEDNNAPVLDLGSMFSFTDFVDYYVHSLMTPDEYLYSWLVFDPMSKLLKSEVNENVLNDNIIHLVLKPDTANYYSTSTSTIKYDKYENNLNFAPKFLRGKGLDTQGNSMDVIKYRDGVNGNEIINIFDTPDEYSNVQKFFTLQDRKISEISKINNDYVPNADETNKYPMFDFREMLTMNQSLLNRLNIVSIAPDKRVYNAYFGHATAGINGTDYDYDVIAIGSFRQNHNMNSNITLTNSANNFSEFDRIRMDLPTFHKEQAVFDKIVLKKFQGEGMYYAIVSVSNTNTSYVKTVAPENIVRKTKYMKVNPEITASMNSLHTEDVDKFYKKQYFEFDAAKYLNDMDDMGFVIFDDDPQYPRAGANAKYNNDGYILINIPTEDVQLEGGKIDPGFGHIRMLGGFDNCYGDSGYEDINITNKFSTFICYFQDAKYIDRLKATYGPQNVTGTDYTKNKLWLKLINVQEIVTGSKYIR